MPFGCGAYVAVIPQEVVIVGQLTEHLVSCNECTTRFYECMFVVLSVNQGSYMKHCSADVCHLIRLVMIIPAFTE